MTSKAIEALCQSAATSYRGNLTPDALLAFLRRGVVADDCRTQLEYAIEEVPTGMWRKALRDFGDEEQAQMRRMVHRYAEARRLKLTTEMVAWLR
ncbi:hypothetical protein [Burkholderia latens]|uniref:hypothetical protein n=1 Tax=Burkholderia latens TaxID=488446 RepID=UPI001AE7E427|nr:hypothetical protein [Burkholderia latens]QTO47446.1 hypothetical protein J8I86_10445 [Burkholderia latens]